MAKEKNPINQSEKDAEESVGKRVEPSLESDDYSQEEQKKIVEMVMDDIEAGLESQKEWVEIKKKEMEHLHNEPPSKIENIKKKSWMSDRNLGLLPGISDIYQATLLSTCYNPDSIHYIATEDNDVDSRDNLTRFTKWGLGKNEANFFPEVDDFISNRTGHGVSYFKICWEVEYRWIDKRIPVYSKIPWKKNKVMSYEIKEEERRFERGVIRNIDNVDNIILPSYGKYIQELEFFIERIHLSFANLVSMSKRNIIKNFDEAEYKGKLRTALEKGGDLRAKKLELVRIKEIGNDALKNMPIDCYEWYGEYEKNGKLERYRFLIEPITETLLSGKPLRKINRDGKIPYVGGPLRRVPGQIRGGSLVMLISNLINALNNNYNQTSDFQYIQNMPFGFANLSEMTNKGVHELEPGKVFNVEESPVRDMVYFPNLSRSLAWSYQDKEFLMQTIERLTGAASYFLTTDAKQATATRDAIVNEKSETKFGLWVKRIQEDICEAINMWINLYQESAPRDLASRILGEDGERLFKNLSIDDLRGGYDAQMTPDITNGSKVYEKQVKLWGLEMINNSIWFNPQINPRGNWMITKEAMKSMGYNDAEKYLPPQPKAEQGSSDEVKNEFQKMKQGDVILPPPEGVTPLVIEHYMGHMKQKEEKYNELPEEYRPNFDAHVFATFINYMKYIRQVEIEDKVNQVAMNAVGKMQRAAEAEEESAEQESPNIVGGGLPQQQESPLV